MRHFFVTTLAGLAIALSAVGVRADNQTAAEKIATRLSEQFPDDDITVQYQDGRVWLRGEVDSNTQMLKMIQFVSNLEGVQNVENELSLLPMLMLQENTVSPAVLNESSKKEEQKIVQSGVNAPVQRPYAQQAVARPMNMAPAPAIVQTGMHREARALQTGGVGYDNGGAYGGGYAVHVGTQAPMPMGGHAPSDYIDYGGAASYGGQPAYGPCAGGVQGSTAGGSCPNLPRYAWPSYAAHPNYAQVTYPRLYQAKTWPNIGPFYPYPEPPLGWRKVTMEWHDGRWWLDFDDGSAKGPFSPIFREQRVLCGSGRYHTSP